MVGSDNRFFGFCIALCNRDGLSDFVFEGFLDALRPVYPAADGIDISDHKSIERFVVQFKQAQEARLDRAAGFAQINGHYCSASDVKDVLDEMARAGIPESDFEAVFRRWRAKMAPGAGAIPSQEVAIDDPEPVIRLSLPAMDGLVLTDSRAGFSAGSEEFQKAIQWVRMRARIAKVKSVCREWIGILPAVGVSLLILLFWSLLPTVASATAGAIWSSVKTIQGAIFWRFAGTAFGITAGVDLLIWGIVKASTGSGSAIDNSHEWRLVTRSGSPGGRVRAATIRDLYNHTHGHGAWERRNSRMKTAGAVLASVAVLVCPLFGIPSLQEAGVQGTAAIIGYYLVYPLLPLAAIGVLVAVIAGLAYWLSKSSPPLRMR